MEDTTLDRSITPQQLPEPAGAPVPEVVRLICVVHGVGSQKKGEFLSQVVEPLTRWARAWRGESSVDLWAQLRPEQGPARATIRISFPRRKERWEFVEAHWASSFYPEEGSSVLAWGYRMLLEFPEIVPNMLREIFGEDPPPRVDPAYRPVQKSLPSKLYDWLVGLTLGIVWQSLYLAMLALGLFFFLLSLFPSWLLFPNLAEKLVRGMVETLIEGIGDLLAIVKNPASNASIVNVLSAALNPFFDSRGSDQRPASLVVLAHSGGTTPSFCGMSDASFWQRVAQTDTPPVPTTLLTVGSSLNFAWLTGRWLSGEARSPLWNKHLPEGLRWVDVYTRYDPVPHGQPREDLVRAVLGGAELNVVRVVNQDSFFGDHGAYWQNYEEFVSRLVYEIMEQDAAALRQINLEAIKDRRRRIGTTTFLQVLMLLGSFGALVGYRDAAFQVTSSLLHTMGAAASPE